MNDGQSNDTEAAEQRTARMLSDIGCIPSDKQCKWHSLKNSVCTIPATDATHTERSAPRTECTAIEAALSKIMLTTTGALRKIAYGKKVVFPRTTDSIVADFASRLGAGATASDLRAAEARFGSSIEEIHSLLYKAIHDTILRRQDDKHPDCSLLNAAYDVLQGGPGVPVTCQHLVHEARSHPDANKDFVGMVREEPARMEGQTSPSRPAAACVGLAPSAASVAPTSLNYRDPGREAKEAREARLRQTPRSLAATAIAICDDLPRTAEDQQACCGWLTAECGRAIRDSQSSVETACIEAHHTQSMTNLKRFLAVVRDCDMSQDSFIAATMSEDEYGLVIDSDTPHEALQVQDIDDILPLGVRITMAGQDETGSSGPTVAGRPKRQLTLEMPMRPMPAPAGSAPALFASLPGAQVDLHGQHEGMTRGPQHSESGITGFGVVGVDPYAMIGFEQADWPPSAEQAMVGSSTAGPALDVFGNLGQGPWDANWPDMGDPRPQTIPVSPYGYTNKSLFLHGDDPFPMHAGPSQVDWQVPTDFGPPLAAAGATDAAADPRSAIHQSRETSTPSCAELNEYQRLGLDPTFSINPQPPAEYTEAAQKTFQGKPWAVAGMTPAMREQLANDTAISNGMLDYRCDFTSAESDLTPWSTVSHILSNVTKIPRTAIQQAGCKQQLLTARGRLLAKAKHDSELGVHKHFEEASHLLDGTLEVLRTDTKTKMKAYLEALRQSAPGSASAGIDEGSLASQFRCLRQAVTSSDMPIKERIEETAPDEAVRRAESRADGLYAVAELNLA